MKLSVIVCTRNRAQAVSGCLDSIAEALGRAAPIAAEIVIVDNASTDDTATTVNEWAKTCAFPVRVHYERRKGLSVSRNSGIRIAQGELLVFTDDDCQLDKDYIVNLLRHDAADTGMVLRGGRVELGNPTDLFITVKTDPEPQRWHRQLNSARHENLGKCMLGCNMAMRRAVIDRLGYFDERMGAGTKIPGGEDTDYILRAYLANIAIEYTPDLVIRHYHGRRLPAEGYKLFRGYCMGEGALNAKYLFRCPDFCRPTYWDMKKAIKEILVGRNNYMPQIDFSYKTMMYYICLGALRYLSMLLIPQKRKQSFV